MPVDGGRGDRQVTRKTTRRDYWYGRSRANRWPLWISWLLAPTTHARQMCRTLMQLRKDGVDV